MNYALYLLINLRKNQPGPYYSDKFYYILSESLFTIYKKDAIPYLSYNYIALNSDRIKENVRELKKPQ